MSIAARRKKKLLVLLGAGSSTPCGMPSVADLDAQMKTWSPQWTHLPTFPEGAAGNGVFNDLWALLEKYMQQNPRLQLGLRMNFERVLGEMTSLASWVTPSPFGNALREAVVNQNTSTDFSWPQDGEGPFYYRNLIVEQQAFLFRKLAEFMRVRCRDYDSTAAEFLTYRNIFDTLHKEFETGIYSLNYDDLAVRAWPEAFTGFREGHFEAQEVASRREWNFVYHPHGSVHYSLAAPPFSHAVEWKDDLSGAFDDSQHLMPNMASNFIPIVPTTLIAGGYKLDQLLSDPAQSFYAALVRHVHEADAILLVGYGFGDVHVNRALQNRYRQFPYNPDRRPPIIIITKTTPQDATIGERQGYEFYAWELTHTINTRFPSSGESAGPVSTISELIEQNAFETCNFGRASVWHNGFIEASGHMVEVVNRLNR
jgi:hypothetical protein